MHEGTRRRALFPHRGQELGQPHLIRRRKKNRCPAEEKENASVSFFSFFFLQHAGEGRAKGSLADKEALLLLALSARGRETERRRAGRSGARSWSKSERSGEEKKKHGKRGENHHTFFFFDSPSSTSSLCLSAIPKEKESVCSWGLCGFSPLLLLFWALCSLEPRLRLLCGRERASKRAIEGKRKAVETVFFFREGFDWLGARRKGD